MPDAVKCNDWKDYSTTKDCKNDASRFKEQEITENVKVEEETPSSGIC